MDTALVVLGLVFLLAMPEILDDVAKAVREWERNNSSATDKE